jgi:hypothetical protein
MSYIILLQGHLDQHWELLLDGFSITHQYTQDGQPVTKIHGEITDQSDLYGAISHLRDIGAVLISINPIRP